MHVESQKGIIAYSMISSVTEINLESCTLMLVKKVLWWKCPSGMLNGTSLNQLNNALLVLNGTIALTTAPNALSGSQWNIIEQH